MKNEISSQPKERGDVESARAALDAIHWITTVPTDTLRVTARNGWLILEGAEAEWDQKEAAESAVRHLPGVLGVTNLIAVAPVQEQSMAGDPVETAFRANRTNVEVTAPDAVSYAGADWGINE